MVSAGIYQVTKEEHENHPRKKRDYEGVIKLRWTTVMHLNNLFTSIY